MANAQVETKEIRFVIEKEITHVYALCNCNEAILGVQGWHYKAFPASVSCIDILQQMFTTTDHPMMWPQKAP